jgi:hypothetical protein
MTANELVDKLESVSIRLLGKETEQAGRAIILYRESAIMLQQQAKEIEALKKEAALQRLSDFTQEAENKPVAWMTENGTIFDELPPISGGLIPLYTHPMRELTDEEIMEIYDREELYNIDEGQMYLKPIDFARAILKKAGEK